MNRISVKLVGAMAAAIMLCLNLNAQTSWIQKSNLPGTARTGAVSFAIGNYAYTGLGYSGTTVLKDFWRYSPSSNSWMQIADFGGDARQNAVAFVVNDTVYIGTGDNGYPTYARYNDFWKYNPSQNKWIQVKDFGGSARTGAAAFAIGDRGYVVTGSIGSDELKDVWEYNPATDTWTQKNDFGSDKRKNAVGFSINGKGYICSGWSFNPYTNILSDVQEYDPATDKWTEKIFADGSLSKKQSAGCFVIDGKAYLVSGNNTNTTVVYNPATNALSTVPDFGPSGETQRNNTIAFAVNAKGYAGLGYVMVDINTLTYKSDLWTLNIVAPPADPTGLTATSIDNAQVKLDWNDNSSNETYFIIEYSEKNNTHFAKLDSVYSNVHSYTAKGLKDSTLYYFRIKAKNDVGYSGYTGEASGTTFAWHVPNAPTNLKVALDNYGYFMASYTDNATNDSVTYIEWSSGDSLHFEQLISIQNPATFSNSSTKDSTTYFFRVRSMNRAGYSAYSNISSCTTQASKPEGLTAVSVSPKEIDILWRDNSSVESGFIIERSVNDSLHFEKIDSLKANYGYYYYKLTYNDYNVTEGNIYYYRVASVIKGKRVYSKKMDSATPMEVGGWTRLPDYPASRSDDGFGFYYNDTVYMGFGWNGQDQFWAFNTKTRLWSQKADLGQKSWEYANTLILNNNGYAFMGRINSTEVGQVWEYNFAGNQWSRKTNTPLNERYGCVSFALGDKGYFLGGQNNSNVKLKDFWEYDATSDTWNQLADFPGGTCAFMPVVVYNEKAYLLYKQTELWEFSLPSKAWTKVRTLKKPLSSEHGFNIGEKFIYFSSDYDINLITLWEYDFLKDTLVKKSYFPGYADRGMTYAQRNNEIYVGCGAGNGFTSEVWMYSPYSPAAPTKLAANPVTQKKVSLSWTDNSNFETKYYIERRESSNATFTVIDSTNANVNSFTDTTVLADKSYYYKVRAKSDQLFSDYSNTAFAMTKVPSKPSIYSISTEMDSSWVYVYISNYSDGITGNIIERSTDGVTFAVIDTIPSSSYYFKDNTVIVGKEYTYRTCAYNTLGNSAYSSTKKGIPGSLYQGSVDEAKITETVYFDPYGYDADYSHCHLSVQKLYPAVEGQKLTINFSEFSLYQNDTLTIFNGPDTNSPVIGKFTSNNKPDKLICATNNDGCLTARFVAPCGSYSNGYYGWKAIIRSTSIFPPSALKASFLNNKTVSLSWTDNSDNEIKFIIERSAGDSLHFNAIDSVAENSISYTDTSVVKGIKYYYCLKVVKEDGVSDHSNMVSVYTGTVGIGSIGEDFSFTIFPNPARTNVNIRFYSAIPEKITVTISNALGQPIRSLTEYTNSGSSDIGIEMQGEPDGLYYVQVKTKTGTITKSLILSK